MWSFTGLSVIKKYDFILARSIPFQIDTICSENNSKGEYLSYLRSIKNHLEKQRPSLFKLNDLQVPSDLILATLDEYINFCSSAKIGENLYEEFFKRFVIIRVNRTRHRVFFTGYFMPEISASHTKKDGFNYPLYAKPKELKRIPAGFDKEMDWGMETEDGFKPYYTRYEIDFEGKIKDIPVLAWVPTPVDGLMIHIQGSAILDFGEGNKKIIRYSANNGHKYQSVCRYFIEKGLLKKDECTWENIYKIWSEKPFEFVEASKRNPRYIFFELSDNKNAIGASGHYLLGKRAIALDNTIYPYGLMTFIRGKSISGFMVNLDRGAAIKGHGRVDVYLGEGMDLVKKAQRIKEEGELYIILKRDPLLEGVKGWR